MTREVATVAPDTSLADIVALLEKRNIRRVMVVQQEKLVGVVSRSDLVEALAAARRTDWTRGPIADEAILRLLLAELRRQAWWRSDWSNVTVTKGVVTYAGVVDSEDERLAARVAAEIVPGVRGVVDRRAVYRDLPSMV
jgi:CBS domain-containing protein